MSFLRMIRDHVSSSFHISLEDMEYAPFDAIGGPFRFRKLFGDRADAILDNLNAALAASVFQTGLTGFTGLRGRI